MFSKINKFAIRLRSLPTRWKVLLMGQSLVTLGLIVFRIQFVNKKREREMKELEAAKEVKGDPTAMPTEHQKMMQEEYEKLLKERSKKKQQQQKQQPNIPSRPIGISPHQLGMSRNQQNSSVALTHQVLIPEGVYWFGTQLDHKGKVMPSQLKDGANPKKKVQVKSFYIDEDCVTNAQFSEFVDSTGYITVAELYQYTKLTSTHCINSLFAFYVRWSFVLDGQCSREIVSKADAPGGMGRVQNAKHWVGVIDANWKHPYGPDSSIQSILNHPVVHMAFTDALEYCYWAGRRLPSEKEWEYAARGGLINNSYPWGNEFKERAMNIWDGANFPKKNLLTDGYYGTAPIISYSPNAYGVYNMLGNVWEWVKGGDAKNRILRGGSFIDSKDGKFNHLVLVSTRHTNDGDSGASNVGFRCASSISKLETKEEL